MFTVYNVDSERMCAVFTVVDSVRCERGILMVLDWTVLGLGVPARVWFRFGWIVDGLLRWLQV